MKLKRFFALLAFVLSTLVYSQTICGNLNHDNQYIMGYFGDNNVPVGSTAPHLEPSMQGSINDNSTASVLTASPNVTIAAALVSSNSYVRVGNINTNSTPPTVDYATYSDYIYSTYTLNSNSAILRLNRVTINTVSGGNGATFKARVTVYDTATSTETIVLSSATFNSTSGTLATFTTPYDLQPGKTYQIRIYLGKPGASSASPATLDIDNPVFRGLAIPNVTTTSLVIPCAGTTVPAAMLNATVASATPADLQLRWFSGSTNVTGTAVGPGTYTPYYYDSVNSCYQPAGSSVTVSAALVPPVKNITNVCSTTTADLATAYTGTLPGSTSLVWFTNNAHTGTALSATQAAQAGAGTYYAFYYDSVAGCYSPASNAVTVTIASLLDSDGDTISDQCDQDKDNDGILDTNECVSTDKIANGTFLPTGSGGTVASKPNWTISGIFYDYANYSTSFYNTTGILFLGDNSVVYRLTQNTLTNVSPGSVINISLSWYNNSDISNEAGTKLEVLFNSVVYATIDTGKTSAPPVITGQNGATVTGSLPGQQPYSVTSSRQYTSSAIISIKLPINSTAIIPSAPLQLKFTGGVNATQADDMAVQSVQLLSCNDSDGDTIPDYLDLDSDNDGCQDAIEGGAGITPSQLVNSVGIVSVGTPSTASNKNLCAGIACVDANGIPQFSTVPSGYSNTMGQSVSEAQDSSAHSQCVVCVAGSTAPVFSDATNYSAINAAYSIACGSSTADLSALTATNQPAGTSVTWHTAATATNANKVSPVTAVAGTTKLYAAFYDTGAGCYSPTQAVTVYAPICAANDNYTSTPITAGVGGTLPSIFGNDTYNGTTISTLPAYTVQLLYELWTPANAIVDVAGDGTLTIPASVPVGTYTYTYKICDNSANATPGGSCKIADVTFVVKAPCNAGTAQVPLTGNTKSN